MLEYDFLRIINEPVRVYREFPLPVIIADTSLKVYWSNGSAKALYSYLTETEGLRRAFREYDMARVAHLAEENGCHTIRDVFPLGGVDACFLPVGGEDGLAGWICLLMGAGTILDWRRHYQTGRTATALSNSIRESVDEIFSIMDVAAAKADLMDAEWAKAGFNRLSLNNYRILRLAGNMAEYARFQAGELLNLQPADLFTHLRDGQELVKAICASMEIPLRADIPSGHCVVQMDAARFDNALFNVIHNALFFTRPGNEIRVVAECRDGHAAVTVTDKGIGIPADMLENVCRPYFVCPRNDGVATTGLGLAVAKTIMEGHGGGLTVSSVEGEGVQVLLTLPLSRFSQRLPLGQGRDRFRYGDRFSIAYIGLSDAALSPYHP